MIILNTHRCIPSSLLLALAWAFLQVPALYAQPDFSTAREIGGLIIYDDATEEQTYYYAPGELILAEDEAGQPDLKLLTTRYTGTQASGDHRTMRFRNILRFRVEMVHPGPDQLRRIKQKIGNGSSNTELLSLPIRRMEAHVVYSTTGVGESTSTELTPRPAHGQFDLDPSEHIDLSKGYWTERIYTMRLDNLTTQAFTQALEQGQVIMSVAYAFYAKGLHEPASELSFSGDSTLVRELKATFEEIVDSSATARTQAIRLIKADAFEVGVDLNRWPDLLVRDDINDRAPSGYGVLEVYCFDFNNELNPELYGKRIEVEATTVEGKTVRVRTTFRSSYPDAFIHTVRFPHAVRLDRPYRFRVTSILNNGDRSRSAWETRYDWSAILDVTSL